MRTFWQRRLGTITVFVVVAICVFWTRQRGSSAREEKRIATPKEISTAAVARLPGQPENARDRFIKAVDAFKSAAGLDSRGVFAELHGILSGMSREAASTTLRSLLDSNVDAPSQLDFSVGPDGFLKQPSSLRVFLLDQLGRVDRAAAAAYAEKVLSSLSSLDEWAVSLRNYALGMTNAAARAFLQQKLREMLRHGPWQSNPSVGFLEAFDVAVHTGGTQLLPDLTELARLKENQAVAHAAYLALDRLTIQDPAAVLDQLHAEPDWMKGREVTRANYFARANVEDTRQKAILESYLLDPRRPADELQTFAGLFPSGNFSVSHNLLTRVATPTRETQARQDREALRVVEGWLADPRFESRKPYLQQIKYRLESFVGKPREEERQ